LSQAISSPPPANRPAAFTVGRAGTCVVCWRYPTTASVLSPVIEAGGVLVGGDSSGRLYAFRPTG
jgi:hypothetical protein